MNSRRSRRALVLCMAPHAGAWGWGALSLLSLLMWWSWLRSNPAFDWYALIARTPRLEPPWTPPALASAVGLRRLGRTALEGPQIARFSPSPRLAGLAPSASPRGSRASLLLASQPRQRSLSCFAAFTSRCAAESSTALSAAATFIACSFCAFHSARVRRCFFGPRRAIPQWIATWA